MVGPSAGARIVPTPIRPMAMPRLLIGNTWAVTTMPMGVTTPAAAPWTTRAINRVSRACAAAPRNEPAMNTSMAPM